MSDNFLSVSEIDTRIAFAREISADRASCYLVRRSHLLNPSRQNPPTSDRKRTNGAPFRTNYELLCY